MSTKTQTKNHSGQQGVIHHAFLVPEFLDYERGPLWYLGAGVFILVIFAVGILANVLTLVLAISLFVAVYWILHQRQARPVEVLITEQGIKLGSDFFPYAQLKHFWVHWDPPYVTDLKLEVRRKFQPILTVHALGQDVVTLRKLLKPHLPEVHREESLIDLLTRILRI